MCWRLFMKVRGTELQFGSPRGKFWFYFFLSVYIMTKVNVVYNSLWKCIYSTFNIVQIITCFITLFLLILSFHFIRMKNTLHVYGPMSAVLQSYDHTDRLYRSMWRMRVWCPCNGKLHSSLHGLRCHRNQTWLIDLCDKICDQHSRDDDNSYKELEFDRSSHRILWLHTLSAVFV